MFVAGDGLQTGTANCNYASGLKLPYGLAFDSSSGALYVADWNRTVCRVPPGGGARGFGHVLFETASVPVV